MWSLKSVVCLAVFRQDSACVMDFTDQVMCVGERQVRNTYTKEIHQRQTGQLHRMQLRVPVYCSDEWVTLKSKVLLFV